MTPAIHVHEDLERAARAAASFLRERAGAMLEQRDTLKMALAGGSTPRRLYACMRELPWPWPHIELCFGDERCVPPNHPDSNARMVDETLVQKSVIPRDHVHRMRGELPPAEAARDYEQTLRRLFGGDDALPRFDIVLLGLGADGHTASLFPYSAALGEERAWVVPNVVPGLPSARITLTYPVLNAARLVLFLVAGSDKAHAVHEVLEGQASREHIPARGVRPSFGELLFFLDRAAAAGLARP